MSWLRIPRDAADADPEEIAALRDFLVTWWGDSITEQTLSDPELSAADLEKMLRLLEDKVYALPVEALLRVFHQRTQSAADHDTQVH